MPEVRYKAVWGFSVAFLPTFIIRPTRNFPLKYFPDKKCFGEIKNGVFSRTGAHFFVFEPLGGFDCRLTEILCSVVAEMSTNSFKMHLGSILMDGADCNNFGKIREIALK